MSKGLEALEDLMNDLTPMSFSRIEKLDRYKVIEKELKRLEELENENLVLTFGNTVNQGKLKALEIIKNHCHVLQKGVLPQYEQDLLNEVLL